MHHGINLGQHGIHSTDTDFPFYFFISKENLISDFVSGSAVDGAATMGIRPEHVLTGELVESPGGGQASYVRHSFAPVSKTTASGADQSPSSLR